MSRYYAVRDPRIEASAEWPWHWYVCWHTEGHHHARGCFTLRGARRLKRRIERRIERARTI